TASRSVFASVDLKAASHPSLHAPWISLDIAARPPLKLVSEPRIRSGLRTFVSLDSFTDSCYIPTSWYVAALDRSFRRHRDVQQGSNHPRRPGNGNSRLRALDPRYRRSFRRR